MLYMHKTSQQILYVTYTRHPNNIYCIKDIKVVSQNFGYQICFSTRLLIMVFIFFKYVELTRPKIESRQPIFFTSTRARSRVSGNDWLFPHGSEFGPNSKITASPRVLTCPRPDQQKTNSSIGPKLMIFQTRHRENF